MVYLALQIKEQMRKTLRLSGSKIQQTSKKTLDCPSLKLLSAIKISPKLIFQSPLYIMQK